MKWISTLLSRVDLRMVTNGGAIARALSSRYMTGPKSENKSFSSLYKPYRTDDVAFHYTTDTFGQSYFIQYKIR